MQPIPIKSLPGCDLSGLGKNPHGEPLYRVVWAPTRLFFVGGKHHDYDGKPSSDRVIAQNNGRDPALIRAEFGIRWNPLYGNHQTWVLEKWTSPIVFAGTKVRWEQQEADAILNGGVMLGPYPEKGEYVGVFEFPFQPPASLAMEVAQMVEEGKNNYSDAQRKCALEEAAAKQAQKWEADFADAFHEAQGPFGGNAVSGIPGKRTTDQVQLDKAVPELPQGKNKFFQS